MSEVKIPEGYKQSEIGVIPEDWETKNIGEDATLKARIGWQALTTNEYQSIGNHYLVTGTDFNAGEVQWDTCWHVDEWRYKQDSNIQLRIDDVLVTKDGTIGKIGYVDELPKPATLNSGVFVIRPKYNSFVPKYFFYVLTSSLFKEFIRNITAGSTITHLYQKDFVTFNFPVPPKPEQTAIATALSDVDNLIGSLEKLIAKKEAIKTGTMQQLLTGKTRLPEFATREDGSLKGFKQTELGRIPEDWDIEIIGKLATIQRGASPRPIDNPIWFESKSKTGWLRISDVSKTNKYLTTTTQNLSEKGVAHSRFIERDSLVMSICATVGKPIITRKDLCIHDGFVFFKSLEADKEYMYYVLQKLEPEWSKMGQTGSQMNLNTALINNTTLKIPRALKEQTAIATVLSDIDTEIQALQQRLDKTRDIKQGIMQQLLTGKVRLAY